MILFHKSRVQKNKLKIQLKQTLNYMILIYKIKINTKTYLNKQVLSKDFFQTLKKAKHPRQY